MDELRIISRLLIITRDELAFLEKGYGQDKPDYVQTEVKELRASMGWLEQKVQVLNDKHTQPRS